MTAYDGAKKMGLVRSVLTMGLIAQVQWFLLDVARRSESPLSPYARGVLDDAMAPLIGVGQGDFFNATGRTILITGASSGIGEALAYEYASHGATLILTARREAELSAVAARCNAVLPVGARATTFFTADLSTESGWDSVRAHLQTALESPSDTLDLLVLNAGISMGSTFEELVAEGDAMRLTKSLMDVNVLGQIGPLAAALPMLLKGRSDTQAPLRIAVTSSLAGTMGLPTRTVYSASKFALKGFFDGLRRELVSNGYDARVTLIYPGVVQTNINRLREGPKHTLRQLDTEKGYSVKAASEIIVQAIAEGRRELLMSVDGSYLGTVKAHLGPWLDAIAPSVLDAMLNAEQKRLLDKKD